MNFVEKTQHYLDMYFFISIYLLYWYLFRLPWFNENVRGQTNWNSNVLLVDFLIDSAVEYIDALLFMIFLDYLFFRLLFSKFLHKNKENGLNKQWFIVIQNSQWTKFVTRYEPLIKCIISHSMIDNKRLEKIIERWWFIGFFIEARATEPIKLRPLSLDDFELEMIDVIPTYLNRFENIQVLRFEFE